MESIARLSSDHSSISSKLSQRFWHAIPSVLQMSLNTLSPTSRVWCVFECPEHLTGRHASTVDELTRYKTAIHQI
jgi:hypothetical protein